MHQRTRFTEEDLRQLIAWLYMDVEGLPSDMVADVEASILPAIDMRLSTASHNFLIIWCTSDCVQLVILIKSRDVGFAVPTN